MTVYPIFTNAPPKATITPVTNQTIQRLPLEATTSAMMNRIVAKPSIAGHSVISSSTITTCSAVKALIGGIDVGTVTSRSEVTSDVSRSEEHTSELQSRGHL